MSVSPVNPGDILAGASLETQPRGSALPLSFEAWAGLSARLMNLDQERRLDVLDERKVKLKDWQRCDEHYVRAMASDIAAGRMARVDDYAQVCAAEMTRRRAEAEAPALAMGNTPAEPAAEPEAPMKIGAPLEAAPAATPSFLQARQLPAQPVAPVRNEPAGTADAFQLPSALRRGALPFRASPDPSPLARPGDPKPPPPKGAVGETMPLTGTLPLGTQLPFRAGPVKPPSALAFPRMTLQSYASFCAERTFYPDRADEVQNKYNVQSDAARIALDHDWQARFEAHPETRAEWERVVAEHRERLLRQPGQ